MGSQGITLLATVPASERSRLNREETMQIKAEGIDLMIRCGQPSDEGWMVAQVEVFVPGFHGKYKCQLMTDDLKVFASQLKEMSRRVGQECTACLSTTDPGISVSLKMDKLGNVHGLYSLKNYVTPGVPTLEGRFEADQTFLNNWRQEIAEELKERF